MNGAFRRLLPTFPVLSHGGKAAGYATTSSLHRSNVPWSRIAAAAAAIAALTGGTAAFMHSREHDASSDESSVSADVTPKNGAISLHEPKETDAWDRWNQAKAFLWGWKKRLTDEFGADMPLPIDKLACHPPPGGYAADRYRPVVLVSCGSFNPPTFMHLRMLELARHALMDAGEDVLGAYLSPVNDAYWKRSLAPGVHRVRMCQLAAATSDFIMVDPWEVQQRQYNRTLHVLQSVRKRLEASFSSSPATPLPSRHGTTTASASDATATTTTTTTTTTSSAAALENCPPSPPPRTVLVCGADVIETMADPTIWKQDLLDTLLSEHGVVCITRDGAGADAAAVLERAGAESPLRRHASNVYIVQDPVPNDVSSSVVRHELENGRSVRYLLPDAVISYIYEQQLFGTHGAPRPRWVHPFGGGHKADTDRD